MIEEENIASISLHYYMQEEGVHEMDAFVHNKCERQLLNIINYLSKQYGIEVKVDIEAKEEGGIKDKIIVIAESALFLLLAEKVLDMVFNPDRAYLDNTKTRFEIAEMIKNSSFTEEEVNALVEQDEELMKFSSSYFKNLSKDDTVTRVETTLTKNGEVGDSITYNVTKDRFQDKIIANEVQKNVTVITATTLYVGSPVLINGLLDKWRGQFNGENILFTIKDNEFIEQVFNREVKFDSGTSLTCDLEISEDVKNGKICKRTFTVLYVRSWTDGSHYQTETKRYIRELAENEHEE